jgi:hypothetical protein
MLFHSKEMEKRILFAVTADVFSGTTWEEGCNELTIAAKINALLVEAIDFSPTSMDCSPWMLPDGRRFHSFQSISASSSRYEVWS